MYDPKLVEAVREAIWRAEDENLNAALTVLAAIDASGTHAVVDRARVRRLVESLAEQQAMSDNSWQAELDACLAERRGGVQ